MRGQTVSFRVTENSSEQDRQSMLAELRQMSGVSGITRASHSPTHKLGRLYIISLEENATKEQVDAVIANLKGKAPLVESVAAKDPRRC